MSEVRRMQQVIALNHVHAMGDAVTRELVESLRDERAAAVRESESLASEVTRLRDDLIDAHRGGLTPAARQVVGRGVWALVAVSGVAAVMLWFVGVAPIGRALRGSFLADAPPVVAGPSWVGPAMTFTSVGPPELIQAVMSTFSIAPTQIDVSAGRLSMRYVDGPYSRMDAAEQSVQAMAIAKFVWRHPARPKGIDTVTVRIERPMRVVGETAVMRDFLFYPEQLNSR